MFTIVLRTLVRDEQFFFTTKNNGNDTVKSPMGMFDTNEIDNDLAFVDSTICDYYGTIANRLKNDYSRSPDMWQRSIAGCYQNNVAWLYTDEKGRDYAQKLLGHKSSEMTDKYRDVRGSEWAEIE